MARQPLMQGHENFSVRQGNGRKRDILGSDFFCVVRRGAGDSGDAAEAAAHHVDWDDAAVNGNRVERAAKTVGG